MNNSNSIFKKIKNDLSSIWAIFTSPDVEKNKTDLDSITANSSENANIINILKESIKDLEASANKYHESIGVPSRPRKQSQAKSNKQEKEISILSRPVKENGIIKVNGDFEREDWNF